MHVPCLLSRIMISGLLLGIVLLVRTLWFHNTAILPSWLVSTDFGTLSYQCLFSNFTPISLHMLKCTRPYTLFCLFIYCTGSFLGVKRPGRGADHPPPSKCRGQERLGLYLYSPSGPSWPVMGPPLPLPLYIVLLPVLDMPQWCVSLSHQIVKTVWISSLFLFYYFYYYYRIYLRTINMKSTGTVVWIAACLRQKR